MHQPNMFNPLSTYRIQFHKDFTFSDFEAIIPYLIELGIKTVYASPIFKSTPGSTHGYDVTDSNIVNPEIGTLEHLENITARLNKEGISWIQDIVPNHMAFHPDNSWLMDVLEKGQQSLYYDFFDITWNSQFYKGRLMVPFLGGNLDDVIKNKEIHVAAKPSGFFFQYYENNYPLHLRSYNLIFSMLENLPDDWKQLQDQIVNLEHIEDSKLYSLRCEEIKMQFEKLLLLHQEFITDLVKVVNESQDLLHQISALQVYQLCHWQETNSRINFRRFFTINGLICLNMQHEHVFNAYHKLTQELLQKNIIQGLRIDHVDGMYDPTSYLQRLRELAGDKTYIVVEKILEEGEKFPDWPVQGSTGYDFLPLVNNLMTNEGSVNLLTKFYHNLTNDSRKIEARIREKKSNILFNRLSGELDNLCRLFIELNLIEEKSVSEAAIKSAIGEFLINCPVYRYYGHSFPLQQEEKQAVVEIFNNIQGHGKDTESGIRILKKVLVEQPDQATSDYNERVARFYMRCMQFTGPIMAKGVEDTLMYTYSRFIGHNEVGDNPEFFGYDREFFHEKMQERQESWPLTLNTTSTHDTKRGEDVRMRLNVISDLPDLWISHVKQWQENNKKYKSSPAPDTNDEYFLYQVIVGSLPFPGQPNTDFSSRIQEYMIKALRESKRHSNWAEPDEEYEKAMIQFIENILNEKEEFIPSLKRFNDNIIDYGIINSLAQVVNKCMCPGIPDIYQGCELWDLSLVDPDNRRAVDYTQRMKLLEENKKRNGTEEFFEYLWNERYSGSIKLWVITQLIHLRSREPDLFLSGHYMPIEISGKLNKNIIGFRRTLDEKTFLIITPLHLSKHDYNKEKPWHLEWGDTRIESSDEMAKNWKNYFTGEIFNNKPLLIADVLNKLPIAVLESI